MRKHYFVMELRTTNFDFVRWLNTPPDFVIGKKHIKNIYQNRFWVDGDKKCFVCHIKGYSYTPIGTKVCVWMTERIWSLYNFVARKISPEQQWN